MSTQKPVRKRALSIFAALALVLSAQSPAEEAPDLANIDPGAEAQNIQDTQQIQQQQPQQQGQQQQVVSSNSGPVNNNGTVFNEKDYMMLRDISNYVSNLSAAERKKFLSDENSPVNFTDENAFVDVESALSSKDFTAKYIRGLASVVTSNMKLGGWYFDFKIGHSYVHQSTPWIEYTSYAVAPAIGFTSESGHVLELGFNLSAVSNIAAGYRKIFGSGRWALRPFAGGSVGMGLEMLNLADGPPETPEFEGGSIVFSAVGGVMFPMPDIAFKVEAVLSFWGFARKVITPQIGLAIFL